MRDNLMGFFLMGLFIAVCTVAVGTLTAPEYRPEPFYQQTATSTDGI